MATPKIILPEKGKQDVLITSALPYVNNVPASYEKDQLSSFAEEMSTEQLRDEGSRDGPDGKRTLRQILPKAQGSV